MRKANVLEPKQTGCALPAAGRRRHAGGCAAAWLAVAVLAAAPTAAVPAAAAGLQVAVDGERMSVALGEAAVADVLAEVARQTGADLSVRGDLGTVRPQKFDALPLAQALPRVAYPNGLILEFASDAASGAGRRLIAIRAVAPGQPGPVGPATAGATVGPRADPRHGAPSGLWSYEKGEAALPSLEERITAIGKISQQRDKSATAALVYVLIADPDPAARRAALGMLASFGDEDARAALTQAVADADPEVRAAALQALARVGPQKPVSLLAQAARGDADATVRITAIGQLSGKDGDLAQAVLRGALADPDVNIRTAAQQALRR